MLNAVIIDDETKAIQSLSWEIANFKDDITVVKTFTSPEEGIEYLKNNEIDCLFLDIEMPTMDGFQVLEKLPHKNFAVVITTAYDEYGIKAVKNNATDYLLKPVDSDELAITIEKVKEYNLLLHQNIDSEKFEELLLNFNQKFNPKKIGINTDGKIVFLEPDEIIFIESDGNYSSLILLNQKKIVLSKKLKEVHEIIPKELFFRVHNSFIININKIKAFYKTDNYVLLDGDYKVPVSRHRKAEFLKRF